MIKALLAKRKFYLIFFSIILSFFLFMFIHNFYIYDNSEYSINQTLSLINKGITTSLLIKNYNMDSFKDYFSYFFQFIAVVILIYSFYRGLYINKAKTNKDISIYFIRISRKNQFVKSFLEFILELLILFIPMLLFSYLGILLYIKGNYSLIILDLLMLVVISIVFFMLGTLVFSLKNKSISHIITIIIFGFVISMLYVDQHLTSNIFAYMSLIASVTNTSLIYSNFYIIAITSYVVLNILLFFINYNLIDKVDI